MIDFVVTWVDGSDRAWQSERASFLQTVTGAEASVVRWRDMGLMRYWFRAVEQFAPWVHRIHFVTWGHLPEWLDTSNPKLNIVRHSDFIPAEYLPTFNSLAIEMNLHRIAGLSEQFVYFNDDMFLGRPMSEADFFRGGLPVDMARESLLVNKGGVAHWVLESMRVINRRHRKRAVLRAHFWKWYSPRYGLYNLLKTASMSVWNCFDGLYDHHCPISFRRSTFERLWNEEEEVLDFACRHHIRSNEAVGSWLMRYEQLVTGQFSPAGSRRWHYFDLSDSNIKEAAQRIRVGRERLYCLNDTSGVEDFAGACSLLADAFEACLPERSSFELL